MPVRSVAFVEDGLEPFELLGFVRPGRYGDLWLARRRSDGATVNIKLLRPELFKDGEAIRRFQREVRLLLAFEQPNMLRILEHGRTRTGDPFLVVEHREGQPLSEVVLRGPLSVEQVRHIGVEVARFLEAANQVGLVHRGLSPEAILLCDNGDVRVVDFGISFVSTPEDTDDLDAITNHGQRLGDPAYMAPEYVEAFHADGRSDVYALGALLYELLVGDPPFVGVAGDVLDAHVLHPPPPPSHRVPHLPAWLDGLVLAMLAKEPANRPTAKAVADALTLERWPY
jgi:eukaryotic-like serine/threonine-protein kinase